MTAQAPTVRTCRECNRPATEHDPKTKSFKCGRCSVSGWRNYNKPPAGPEPPPPILLTCACGRTKLHKASKTGRFYKTRDPWQCKKCSHKEWKQASKSTQVVHEKAKQGAGSCPERAKRIADLMLSDHGSQRMALLMGGHRS